MAAQYNRCWIRTVNGCLAAAILSGPLVGLWPVPAMASSVKEAQAAFDKKQYQEALDLIE